ncbi:MAG: hypothetical protein HQK52_23595 [Oligoflexia bacterium]|nr:hypothetical protein [Oligoflexia bacterium]
MSKLTLPSTISLPGTELPLSRLLGRLSDNRLHHPMVYHNPFCIVAFDFARID